MNIMTEPERKTESNLHSPHVIVSQPRLKRGRGLRTGRKFSGCILTGAENSAYSLK